MLMEQTDFLFPEKELLMAIDSNIGKHSVKGAKKILNVPIWRFKDLD